MAQRDLVPSESLRVECCLFVFGVELSSSWSRSRSTLGMHNSGRLSSGRRPSRAMTRCRVHVIVGSNDTLIILLGCVASPLRHSSEADERESPEATSRKRKSEAVSLSSRKRPEKVPRLTSNASAQGRLPMIVARVIPDPLATR